MNRRKARDSEEIQSQHQDNYTGTAFMAVAGTYYGMKNYERAISLHDAYMEKHPCGAKQDEALLNMAKCQIMMKDYAEATKTLRRVVFEHSGSKLTIKARRYWTYVNKKYLKKKTGRPSPW